MKRGVKMNVIIDYGRGNLKSVLNAFDRVGIEATVSNDINKIKDAKSLIIPGVGAFTAAMEALNSMGLTEVIKKESRKGKNIIGICLGMQLLYQRGYEFGETQGIGLIEGDIKFMDIPFKVPHMGWNNLKFNKPNEPILKYINEDDYVYFVHSYYASSDNSELVAYSEYGVHVPAIVRKDNVYGIQFHPEKSGDVGEKILKAYKEIIM